MTNYLSNKLLSFIQSLKKNNIYINKFQVSLFCDNCSNGALIDLTGFFGADKVIGDIFNDFKEICNNYGFIPNNYKMETREDIGLGFESTLQSTMALDMVYYITEEKTAEENDKNKCSSDTEKTEEITYEKQDRFELLDMK